MSDDRGAFDDADQLPIPEGSALPETLRSLLRADLSGTTPGAFLRSFDSASPEQREAIASAWEAAVDAELYAFIVADRGRARAAEAILARIAPRDPSPDHNQASLRALRGFTDWQAHPYAMIIVPGFTPLESTVATPGVHPITRRRLEQAIEDLAQGKAPFLLVTGGNVYPKGTPYHEAIEMKAELVRLGVPDEQIVVEARARHSTTNLRNAGRILREHGLRIGLITTVGGGIGASDVFDQSFYFSNPTLSTFYSRCVSELGYRVGELRDAGPMHTEFTPAPEVMRVGLRDALDP
jgi:uncharacterized SAM-binding protein YcdF (DUF218 family)